MFPSFWSKLNLKFSINSCTYLGLTKQEVAAKYVHSTYDGVYELSSQRENGGLSLVHHFAEWCGLEQDDISGHWDVGHQLQLVYKDAFKDDEDLINFNNVMYDTMSDYNYGKPSAEFRETADSLKEATLTVKSRQTTRWVRSEIRSTQAYLRNLPTLSYVVGKKLILI